MRQQPILYEKTMLPYKGPGFIRSYSDRMERPTQQDNIDRALTDQTALLELTRKVDWLIDEVRNIKQTLMINQQEKKKWERESSPPYREYKTRLSDERDERDNLRLRLSDDIETNRRQERVSSRDNIVITYYDHPTERESPRRRPTFEHLEYECEPRVSSRTRTYPYELLSRGDHDSLSSDSPISTGSKTDRLQSQREVTIQKPYGHLPPDDINIAEIILLWQRGMNDIPPILSWSQEQKLLQRERLTQWFRIYHLFSVACQGDIGRFIAQYTDTNGKMMTASHVASLCPDVSANFNTFLHAREHDDPNELNTADDERIYILPRKINGRKVSAKDVIQLWEHGMGDIAPIKSWSKTQKFKQQSKISRWKKIVDIFKYQCGGDMKKFEEIYSDVHGCLLPVAAITSKFETIYGDELNLTSKLMTVSTAEESFSAEFSKKTALKRSFEITQEQTSPSKKIAPSSENLLPEPPLLIRRTLSPPNLIKDDSINHSMLNSGEDYKEKPNSLSISKQIMDDTFTCDYQSSPSNSESELEVSKRRTSTEIYLLPEKITLQDMVMYWERGSSEFPPIKLWTPQQKHSQKDLIISVEKLYFLFSDIFKHDISNFLSACSKEGNAMSVDEVLNKHTQILKDKFPGESMSTPLASSMTFDFSHHKTISQSTDTLYLLPRKINGRKVNAKDVLQLWYHGLNKIPAVKQWSPQQKAIQQSKISRWKKIVDLFEQEFSGNWEIFEKRFSNNLGQLLPITAIITKYEEDCKSMSGTTTLFE